jgi:hypothetical protein
MTYLAKLRNLEKGIPLGPSKPSKPGFEGFEGAQGSRFSEKEARFSPLKRAARSARKARYRAHLKANEIVVPVVVTLSVIELLLDTRYFTLAESEDRSAIAVAIEEMLADASKHR